MAVRKDKLHQHSKEYDAAYDFIACTGTLYFSVDESEFMPFNYAERLMRRESNWWIYFINM